MNNKCLCAQIGIPNPKCLGCHPLLFLCWKDCAPVRQQKGWDLGTRDSFRLTPTLQTQPAATSTFKFFKFYVCILCVHTHLSAVPTEVRRGYGVPRNWSYWQL